MYARKYKRGVYIQFSSLKLVHRKKLNMYICCHEQWRWRINFIKTKSVREGVFCLNVQCRLTCRREISQI